MPLLGGLQLGASQPKLLFGLLERPLGLVTPPQRGVQRLVRRDPGAQRQRFVERGADRLNVGCDPVPLRRRLLQRERALGALALQRRAPGTQADVLGLLLAMPAAHRTEPEFPADGHDRLRWVRSAAAGVGSDRTVRKSRWSLVAIPFKVARGVY
ncbi:MAG: hypothetical protein ACRET0_06400 [Steroidobacteraceae bacterium]